MKSKLKSLLAAALVACGLISVVGWSGCQSTPSTSALKASGVTHVGVTSGLRTWDVYVGREAAEIERLETASATKEVADRKAKLVKQATQVRDAYRKYQDTQTSVLTVAQEIAKIPPDSTNAPAGQDRLAVALSVSTVALNEVANLLVTFGVAIE